MRYVSLGFALMCALAVAPLPVAAAETQAGAPSAAAPNFEGVWLRRADPLVRVGNVNIGGTRPYQGPPPATEVPLQPAARAIFDQSVADARAGKPFISNRLRCLPEGAVDMMFTPYMMQIVQGTDKIYILAEWGNQVRHVYMNAEHAAGLPISWNGHSTGRWEGNTLVVDTVGIDDRASLLTLGGNIVHSRALHVVERYTLSPDGKTLTNEMTIEDPETFTQPWTIVLRSDRQEDQNVVEFVCADAPLDLNG